MAWDHCPGRWERDGGDRDRLVPGPCDKSAPPFQGRRPGTTPAGGVSHRFTANRKRSKPRRGDTFRASQCCVGPAGLLICIRLSTGASRPRQLLYRPFGPRRELGGRTSGAWSGDRAQRRRPRTAQGRQQRETGQWSRPVVRGDRSVGRGSNAKESSLTQGKDDSQLNLIRLATEVTSGHIVRIRNIFDFRFRLRFQWFGSVMRKRCSLTLAAAR